MDMNHFNYKKYQKKNTCLTEQDKQSLQEELIYLQMRLRQIGYNGDCAYEKKLAVFYDNAVLRCKEKLRPGL